MNKFGAKQVVINGILFPSKAQANRYQELKLLERAGEITELQLEVNFPLVVNGIKICTYRGDFTYFEKGKKIVEDKKGFRTPVFKLKAKLMLAVYGIEIRET